MNAVARIKFMRSLLLLLPLSTFLLASIPVQAQTCLSYWVNPKTGQEECFGAQSSTPAQPTAPKNFSVSELKLVQTGSSEFVTLKGKLTNISNETHEISAVDIDLISGQTILKSVSVPLTGNLAPGQSKLISYLIAKEDLNKVPARQVTLLPLGVAYR